MYATAFDYVRASSWAEAVERLEQLGEDAHVIAGGQSLVPMMMLRMAAPTALVDVGGAGERTIEVRDGTLELSALVRHVDLEHSDTVAAACPMLTEAVRHIGNVRVRQRGTIGGSLAHAEATSELAVRDARPPGVRCGCSARAASGPSTRRTCRHAPDDDARSRPR